MRIRTILALPALLAACQDCREHPPPRAAEVDPPVAPAPPPRPPAPPPLPKQVVAWVVPYEDSLRSLEQHLPVLTAASPTYYRVDVQDKVARLVDWDWRVPFPRARAARKPDGPRSLPLVGCIGECGPRVSRVLDDADARRRHVNDLLRVVDTDAADGLFVDYEDVDAKPESITTFLEALHTGLAVRKKTLGLAVQEPCGYDPACKREPYPFVLKDVIAHVDLLAVMEYDLAVDGSRPPAPRDWVERGLDRVVRDVGPEAAHAKVLLGVPYYGRVSKGVVGDTAVLFSEVGKDSVRAVKVGPLAPILDKAALAKVAKLAVDGQAATLYLEDHATLGERLGIADAKKLAGVAIWRLGGEDPCNPAVLARYQGVAATTPCPSP